MLDPVQVDLVKSLMREYGPPLPTGHLSRIVDLWSKAPSDGLPRCEAFVLTPDPCCMAVISMAMLAMRDPIRKQVSVFGRNRDHWFARQALIQFADWPEQVAVDLRRCGKRDRASALVAIARDQRWRVTLHATHELALECESLPQDKRDEIIDDKWLDIAEQRLRARYDEWEGDIPPVLRAASGVRLDKRDARWQLVDQLLASSGADTEFALGAVFCYQFCAHAGLWQPELSDGTGWTNAKWGSRSEVATALLRLLRHGCLQYREVAGLVVAGLEFLPLFSPLPNRERSRRAVELIGQLPHCFSAHTGQGPVKTEVAVATVTDALARQRLRHVLRLAAMVAAQILSAVHVRASRVVPGFTADDYVYFDSRVRHDGNRGTTRDTAVTTSVDRYRQNLATLFRQMKRDTDDEPGRIEKIVDLNLPPGCRSTWYHDDDATGKCAMCSARPLVRGSRNEPRA